MCKLEQIIKTDGLKNIRVIVTGCGYKPVKHTFCDLITGKPTHTPIFVGEQEMKLNIGAATAAVLALNSARVHMVSTSAGKLKTIKHVIDGITEGKSEVEYSEVDLLSEAEVKSFVQKISKDKTLYWVQSIGLGAGSYKLKDDCPYLHVDKIPLDLLESESMIVLRGTHLLMQNLIPVFREQNLKAGVDSKIAIISSMSAIRGYNLGATHCAAKGAISRYANSAMLDLWRDKIYVTDIRPGGVDTGMYDSPEVQKSVYEISDSHGGTYREYFALMPPTSVGKVVATVLSENAHIPSINIVAKGQFPNEGS